MTGRIDPAFWRHKRVLVTGHTGFKGAWLCLALKRLGCEVAGLSLPAEDPGLYLQAGIGRLLSAEHLGEIENYEAVHAFLGKFRPEIVVHFAAQSLVRQSHRNPRRTFATNVMGTVNLLEAARHCDDVGVALIATTDKVYLNMESGRPFREDDRLGGLEPYSASKAATEIVAACWRARYLQGCNVALAVCRAGNVIGGGDWSKERLIPDIVRAAMAGQILDVRNPGAVRPWQFVLDALYGYLLLVERYWHSRAAAADPDTDAWNFGPDPGDGHVEVSQICKWAEANWPGRFSWRIAQDNEGIEESKLLMLDPQKAFSALGWRPKFSPQEAVRRTLDWYAHHLAGGDARELCHGQIEHHFIGNA